MYNLRSYWYRVGILGIAVLLTSCSKDPPQDPAEVVGTPLAWIQASMLTSENMTPEPQEVRATVLSNQSILGAASLEVVRIANIIVDEDEKNRRYVSSVFKVTNHTGRVLNNLHLLAMAKNADSVGGTAVRLLQTDSNSSFNDVAVARAMLPGHSMEIGLTGLPQIDNDKADFQAYPPGNVAVIQQNAIKAGLLSNSDTLLEYGFSTRPMNTRTDHRLLVNESGLVTITMQIPKDISQYKVARFDMDFLAVELSRDQVTRQADESNANAANRASAAGTSYIVSVGLDTPTISSFIVAYTCNVMIGTGPTYLLPNTCRSNNTSNTLLCQRNSGPKVIPGPMISFVSDDGRVEDYTKLLPLFKSKGLAMTSALISSKLIPSANAPAGYSFLTVEQALELQANGWEILSHSRTHPDLVTLSADQIEAELRDSKVEIKGWGLNVGDVLVYPYGSFDLTVKDIACKYYKAALHAWGNGNLYNTNFGSIDGNQIMQLWRLSFGSYTLPDQNTLEFYKARVDDAIAKKGWLIWQLHPWAPAHDATQQQYLSNLIDYIKSKNISVVSINEGLNNVSSGLGNKAKGLF